MKFVISTGTKWSGEIPWDLSTSLEMTQEYKFILYCVSALVYNSCYGKDEISGI